MAIAEQQRRVIWSIQLKLHVPGAPDAFAAQVFDPQSPTFDTGQIGRFREVFTDEAYRRFRALPQDFMQQHGYDAWSTCDSGSMSSRAEEFRHRRLQLSSATADIPFAVQHGYLGFNIVRYGDSYVAVPQGEQIDLRIADLAMLQAEDESPWHQPRKVPVAVLKRSRSGHTFQRAGMSARAR